MKEIFERRSIRHFTDKLISDEIVTTLIKAAMCAPSAGDEQPWDFIVIRDKSTMDNIRSFHRASAPLIEATLAIVICGDTSRQRYKQDYWIQDCSAATQNLLLEAQHLGVGAVWMGVHPVRERVARFKELFSLPENVIPFNVIALGYPNETPEPRDTYRPDRIHFEKW